MVVHADAPAMRTTHPTWCRMAAIAGDFVKCRPPAPGTYLDGQQDHAMKKSTTPPAKIPLVAALAYDQLCTFEFGCVVEVFALSRPELNVDWYRFGVCSSERGQVSAAGGVKIEVPYTLALLDRADIIIIPGWRDPGEAPPELLLRKIRAAYERGARLCSICSGAFVLAWAGVLDGKVATTHWRLTDRLAANFPQVKVDASALYVDGGQILTSAGSASGLDMMLHLVRKDHGSRVANIVAQRLIIPPHREGGQAQFVPRPMPTDEKGRLSKLMQYVRANPAAAHTLETLSERAAMSPRTLLRQFQEATGLSPYDWVIRERVLVAKEMLERSELGLDTIAERAGFGSDESFRRHFRRMARTSPTAYRRSFRAS
jgi:AraC family transcriptional activator FtrA